jgi:hypothetical protein
MVSEIKRKVIFNVACVPLRVGLVLLLYYLAFPELSILTGLISLGFLYKSFNPAKIGFFGGDVYWSRNFHFLTYAITSILLLIEDTREYAFWVLAFDIIASYIYFWYHYRIFKKI